MSPIDTLLYHLLSNHPLFYVNNALCLLVEDSIVPVSGGYRHISVFQNIYLFTEQMMYGRMV